MSLDTDSIKNTKTPTLGGYYDTCGNAAITAIVLRDLYTPYLTVRVV